WNRRHRSELAGADLGRYNLSDRDAAGTVPTKVGTHQSDSRMASHWVLPAAGRQMATMES
ncbi:hypothetical protein, partial [Stenotrophomonas maltophilia]|uniref:hypothetical protein n=1 Tax=Stenotrophomonas maltophilia TaxID=40324 RepID=UPI0005B6BD32